MSSDPAAHVGRPLLVVVSAPSGAGKTTLCDRLLAEFPDMAYSVSCTTRPPREGEVNGRDYHFLSRAEFGAGVERGDFLEHATVHSHQYGTLKTAALDVLKTGRDVLMDIDVQGAAHIRAEIESQPAESALRRGFVDIFIAPPSMATLEARLRKRGSDTESVIQERLRNASAEMSARSEYRHCIENDDLDTATEDLCAIIKAERSEEAQ